MIRTVHAAATYSIDSKPTVTSDNTKDLGIIIQHRVKATTKQYQARPTKSLSH